MCGIVGIFNCGNGAVDPAELAGLNAAMHHRGPDDRGSLVDGEAALAMCRLAIVDLGGGRQPMKSRDGRYVIAFNGECYNYQDVRRDLEQVGRRFQTHSDTEVILEGYAEWGPSILDRLVGMWGLAIYDRRERVLFLARDRLGKKQLYYSQEAGRLVFASELQVVLRARRENRLRPAALAEFLNYSYVGAGETAVSGVHLLPEAHYATVGPDGHLHLRRYWELAGRPSGVRTEAEAAEEAYAMVREAVRVRLVSSDVPVSVMLSSGLDSSTIAYVLTRELGANLQTFSVGFSDGDFDEAKDAGAFALAMQMPWRQAGIRGEDVARDFPDIVRHGSSLQANTAQIVYYYANREIRAGGFKVALNGNGGDELFAGYPTYRATRFYNQYRHLPAAVRRGLASLAGRLPASLGRVSFDYVAKKFTSCGQADALAAHGYWRTIFAPTELQDLLVPDLRTQAGSPTSIYDRARIELGIGGKADINSLLRSDFKGWLIPMLPWSDNMSMAHSVELRFPFLDHRLVEFALGLPPELLFRGWTLKRLMKRFLAPRLPREVVFRKKRGTHVPLGRWLNAELRPLADHYLSAPVLNAGDCFVMAEVERLRREHASGRADHTFKLWNLIVFSAWHETFRISI